MHLSKRVPQTYAHILLGEFMAINREKYMNIFVRFDVDIFSGLVLYGLPKSWINVFLAFFRCFHEIHETLIITRIAHEKKCRTCMFHQ
jgi:hypothetical protein